MIIHFTLQGYLKNRHEDHDVLNFFYIMRLVGLHEPIGNILSWVGVNLRLVI